MSDLTEYTVIKWEQLRKIMYKYSAGCNPAGGSDATDVCMHYFQRNFESEKYSNGIPYQELLNSCRDSSNYNKGIYILNDIGRANATMIISDTKDCSYVIFCGDIIYTEEKADILFTAAGGDIIANDARIEYVNCDSIYAKDICSEKHFSVNNIYANRLTRKGPLTGCENIVCSDITMLPNEDGLCKLSASNIKSKTINTPGNIHADRILCGFVDCYNVKCEIIIVNTIDTGHLDVSEYANVENMSIVSMDVKVADFEYDGRVIMKKEIPHNDTAMRKLILELVKWNPEAENAIFGRKIDNIGDANGYNIDEIIKPETIAYRDPNIYEFGDYKIIFHKEFCSYYASVECVGFTDSMKKLNALGWVLSNYYEK